MRKMIIVSFIIGFSAVFAIAAGAQQENLNGKFLELQEQWERIMQDEYNPSTIQPKVTGRSSLTSVSAPAKHSKKSIHRRSGSYGR